MPAAVQLLGAIPGIDLRVTTSECCGMAGSFGYKSDYYQLSVELGNRLVSEIDALASTGAATTESGAGGCRYLACGTSCRAQIADLAGRRVCHPLQLIDERLEKA